MIATIVMAAASTGLNKDLFPAVVVQVSTLTLSASLIWLAGWLGAPHRKRELLARLDDDNGPSCASVRTDSPASAWMDDHNGGVDG